MCFFNSLPDDAWKSCVRYMLKMVDKYICSHAQIYISMPRAYLYIKFALILQIFCKHIEHYKKSTLPPHEMVSIYAYFLTEISLDHNMDN